jgi:teichoic acid transport system permease protein
MEHQPVAVYLNLARQAALDESAIPLDWSLWLEGAGWAIAVFIIGFIVFWRDEARYGRE